MNASSVRSFGKYLLDEEIARGGMSRVFLARLRGLGGFEKRLIVKQVLPELASDPRFVSMFVQEANTLVRMSHPHIAPVYELGVVDGVYFLAMEYVEGSTLSQILEGGAMAPELVAHFGAQICDALHYAHERFSIVHRDVTPRNVIIDEEGHARLLDFGIAAPVTGEGEAGDGLFGTPGYLSPEQASGEPLGPRTDVFSLGAVLFETLTARRAFFARNVEEAREVLTLEGPDFYPDDRVPASLISVVDRALAREPALRHESARDLGRALRSWLAKNAPEGVGPELGERVRAAIRTAPTSEFPKAPEQDRPESDGQVQTLATSRILDDLLESPPIEAPDVGTARLPSRNPAAAQRDRPGEESLTPPQPDDSAAEDSANDASVPDPATDDSGPHTLAIPRSSESPDRGDSGPEDPPDSVDVPDESGPHTLAIPKERASEEEAERDAPSEAIPRAADPARGFPFAALLAAAAVAGIAWIAWPTDAPIADPQPLQRTEAPPADAEPETPPAPVPEETPVTPPPVEETPPDPPEVAAPTAAPERAARATLTVNALPWAEVELDGRSIGNTPVRRRNIPAGRHTLILRNPNLGTPARTAFEVAPGGAITLIGNLETGSIQRRNR